RRPHGRPGAEAARPPRRRHAARWTQTASRRAARTAWPARPGLRRRAARAAPTSLRLELQRRRVYAVAQAGWLGPVVEHVAKVPAAVAARHLGANHPVAPIELGLDRVLFCGRPEARPARARLELLIRPKE